jgi:hypothetical protein
MRVTFETSAAYVALGTIDSGDGGKVSVTLDGVDKGQTELYFPGDFIPGSRSYLLDTSHSIHTLHLTVTGQPGSGGGTWIYVDGLFFHN